MRTLLVALKILLFLLLLGFAALNSDFVPLRFFMGMEWNVPLALVIFISFSIGLLIGLLACSMKLLKNQRELRSLRKTTQGQ